MRETCPPFLRTPCICIIIISFSTIRDGCSIGVACLIVWWISRSERPSRAPRPSPAACSLGLSHCRHTPETRMVRRSTKRTRTRTRTRERCSPLVSLEAGAAKARVARQSWWRACGAGVGGCVGVHAGKLLGATGTWGGAHCHLRVAVHYRTLLTAPPLVAGLLPPRLFCA
jgi:hypothetical protein